MNKFEIKVLLIYFSLIGITYPFLKNNIGENNLGVISLGIILLSFSFFIVKRINTK